MSMPPWILRTTLLLTSSAFFGGCTSNTEERIALAKLASSCLINSDCESPMVCAFKSCHVECTTSRDCEDGARCIASERPFRVCQLESERDCVTNPDCPTPLVCGVDGECRDGCSSDRDCIEGQTCASGTCADADELDEEGRLPTTTGEPGATEGGPCVYASDCAGVLLCRGQICRIECKADLDCDSGEVCEDTRCVPSNGDLVACVYNSECRTEDGELCRGGACRCTCADDRDCRDGESCDGCGCVSDAPSCTYDSDCATAGQVCRAGACSCECRDDGDCSAGESCDGCGCVPPGGISAGIVYGNVTIESAVDLPLYAGAREIRGSLSIQATTLSTYAAFSDLETVTGSVSIAESGATTVAFPSLVEVGGTLTVTGGPGTTSLSLPAFEKGSLSVTGPALTTITLPLWSEASIASFHFLPSLTALSLPSLTTVSDTLQLTYSENLGIAALPSLEGVGSLSLLFDPTSPGLEEFRAPLLRTMAGTLNVNGTALTSLSFLDPTIGGALEGDGIANASFEANGALSRCAIEAFVSNVGIANAIVTNNLACGTCSGATCAD